ncbi:MAG: OsmC family protein [Thermodesulfovibrionales bacterium]
MVEARVTHIDGLRFEATAGSGHLVVMDGDAAFGGRNSGVRPMELLLVGLGGCTGMDVISVLKKKRQDVTGLVISVKGEKAEHHPKKFTNIKIEFLVRGRNVSEEAVRRAIELSMDKYCSVKATLEGTARVDFDYRIEEEG